MPDTSIDNFTLRQHATTITVILAVSLSVAAKAQYQLPPTVEQQEYTYPTQDGSYYQPQAPYQSYRQQPQRLTQAFGNGARSSSTFNYGQRKVAVQVNHNAANAFVNYDGRHGATGFQFGSSPAERAVNQFPQTYQFQNSLPGQNTFASSNPRQNADYNSQQNVVRNAYTLTNPINGQKYSLNQPSWDQSTYDVNINYKNQEIPQTFTTPAPPLHNFQFHNNFVPQTNIFNRFDQRAPSQSGFLFNNRPVYSNPTLTNFQTALNHNGGYNLQIPQQYPNYETSDPNGSKIQEKLVLTQPSSDDIQFRFSSGTVENEVPHDGNTVQVLPEVPSFESAKLSMKQEIVKNTTVITLIDEQIQQEAGPTSPPLTVNDQTTPPTSELPIVDEAKVRSGPPPAIVQPTPQYYNNLIKIPDYSSLYRTQLPSTQQPTQTVGHNFNLYFQPTTGLETSTPVAHVDQRLQQPGDYYFQTTQKPNQQSEYVFYQSTPATPSNAYQGLLPGQINNGLSSNGNLHEFNPVEDKNQKKETLFSVNGFEEDLPDITTEKVIPQTNGISLEQTFIGNSYEQSTVTEANLVAEVQTTTEIPLTTTVSPFSNVFYGTTVDDNLGNRNGVQDPTTPPSANQDISSVLSGVNIEEYASPLSPVEHSSIPDVNESKSTNTNQESVSNQNHYYSFVSSSTPPVTTDVDQNSVTEATVPDISDSPADSQSTVSTSRGYDREAANRRQKVRVYKKPNFDERTQDQQQSLDRDRVSKHRNEYRGRRIRPNQQNLVTTSIPTTTQRVIPRGRYHAKIPQRGRVSFHRTTTESVVDETPSQPTISPEYSQEQVSQPISSTVSHRKEQSHQRSRVSLHRTTTESVIDETPPQPTIAPEYNQEPVSQPILSTLSYRREKYHPRSRVSLHRTTTEVLIDETPSQPTIAPEYNQEPVSQPISSTVSYLREQSHQKSRVSLHRTTTESVNYETPPEPSFAPEYNQESVSQPTLSTISHRREQSYPRSRVSFHHTATESVGDESPYLPTIAPEFNQEPISHPITSTPSYQREQFHFNTPEPTLAPQLRFQNRQRTRPTVPKYHQETTTILQENVPITDEIKTTEADHLTSRIESNTKQATFEFEQTHPTEAAVDVTEPTKEPEQVFISQRNRIRGPYQRGSGEDRSLRKQERPVFSLKKHNFNGRLKVAKPVPIDDQDDHPEEKKQIRYHAVKQSPQRQMVIRRIKVKSNHRPAESSEMGDQDASGTIRTSYRRNQALQDSQNKQLPSTIVRNSIRFPPRKPLSRFSITTAKEEIQESSSESTVNHQTSPMSASETHGNLGTTITVQDTKHVTTERIEIHQESTTTKVTEKRQTFDDPDLGEQIENTQSLQDKDMNSNDEGVESLNMPTEINFNFESEPNKNPSGIYTAEKEENVWEDESPEEVIIQSLPEESDSIVISGIIDKPQETDVIPSVSPSQNPADIVTRIDVVTSISEEDGHHRRIEDVSDISSSEELVQ